MASNVVKNILGGGALLIIGVAAGMGFTYLIGSNPIVIGGAAINVVRSADNPAPEVKTELSEAATQGEYQPNPLATANAVVDPGDDWPAFNRTIYGDRYSPLKQINTENAANLEVVCTYNTKKLEGFQTGPIVVDGMMYITTAEDIIALDPATCEQKWQIHEDSGLGIMPTNRGVAYIDGKVIRGYPDMHMRAYDAKTGKKLWETFIGDKNNGNLWLTMAPVAWNGMVFAGLAGGDTYNNRGRAYGLDAETGAIMWQTYVVPKTDEDAVLAKLGSMPEEEMKKSWGNPPDVPVTGGGIWTTITVDPSKGQVLIPIGNPAPDFVKSVRPGSNLFTNTVLILDAKTGDYVNNISIMTHDWHDWDMSNAPILYKTRAGKDVMSFAPKDGFLYTYDADAKTQLYREPRSKMLNTEVEFVPGGDEVYFCPGSVGGGEWNGAAYDPAFNLIFTGMNEWCAHAKIEPITEASRKPIGGIWFGVAYHNPLELVGALDPPEKWGGWIYATDADTGKWNWRIRANYPTISGLTPTAGGIMAFGDMGGEFRVVRSSDGKILFQQHFDGSIYGGMVTYAASGKQYIAFPYGTAHPQWPVAPKFGKIAVLAVRQ